MPALIFSVKTTLLQDSYAKKKIDDIKSNYVFLAGCVALPGSLPRGKAQGGEYSGIREPGRLAPSQGTSLASRHAHICFGLQIICSPALLEVKYDLNFHKLMDGKSRLYGHLYLSGPTEDHGPPLNYCPILFSPQIYSTTA